ncbi:MAG: Na+/H+ antiporter NhaA, partial [Labilithrix sp.]|nr:Na+/H+ antiporter NhaA [Labilithrix sp.]
MRAPPGASPAARRWARRLVTPIESFLQVEASSGIVLLVMAALAIVIASSAWSERFHHVIELPVGIRVGAMTVERPLHFWINDGLMTIFFFVVGLEIRREIHEGELANVRRAALPLAAALGGMAAPALLYLAIAGGAPEARPGWGVPMATDIAFAVGVLAILGKRVPAALRVLLLALAVIDDLGAILVIALFYSSSFSVSGVIVALIGFGCIFALQRFGVRTKLAYVVPAVVAWAGIYATGVHPTIAGVIVGLLTPVRAWLGPDGFVSGLQHELERLQDEPPSTLSSHEFAATLKHVDTARREAISPAESLIEALHPWVAFGIMPLFALANAGVPISVDALDASAWTVVTAAVVGLVVGKPVGILLACWLMLRLKVGTLPAGLTLRHLVVLGVVAGVGFTMALFISQLAFTDPRLLAASKLGVLVASGGAAVLGLLLGRLLLA